MTLSRAKRPEYLSGKDFVTGAAMEPLLAAGLSLPPTGMADNECHEVYEMSMPRDTSGGGGVFDSDSRSSVRDMRGTHNYLLNRTRTQSTASGLQSRIYNFLERPTGWKCFIYHFTV